jgi:hypothetical protein
VRCTLHHQGEDARGHEGSTGEQLKVYQGRGWHRLCTGANWRSQGGCRTFQGNSTKVFRACRWAETDTRPRPSAAGERERAPHARRQACAAGSCRNRNGERARAPWPYACAVHEALRAERSPSCSWSISLRQSCRDKSGSFSSISVTYGIIL